MHITQGIEPAVLTHSFDRPSFASQGIGHSHQFFHYDPQTAGGILDRAKLFELVLNMDERCSKRASLQIPTPWNKNGLNGPHLSGQRFWVFGRQCKTSMYYQYQYLTTFNSLLLQKPSIVITLEKLWGWCHQGVAGYLFLSHATSRGHCACHVGCSLDESSSCRVSSWPSTHSDSL